MSQLCIVVGSWGEAAVMVIVLKVHHTHAAK